AGTAVLAQRGYQAARVDDIVRAARTSHGTFYLYFANKEELVRALVGECARELTTLAAELGPVDAGPAGLDELRAWLARFLASYRRHGAVIRAWAEGQAPDLGLDGLGGSAFSAIAASLVQRIREAQPASGAGPSPELAGAALLAMVERFADFVTTRASPVDDDEAVATLAVMVHRGFFGAPA
ncbi:MAG: helix-turn-helix transcriptional regulator, partial [Acidimicrobiia bacterium]|nr:helix-turn-helix transcriptional regulator [Acidimicrobiia bacterium]